MRTARATILHALTAPAGMLLAGLLLLASNAAAQDEAPAAGDQLERVRRFRQANPMTRIAWQRGRPSRLFGASFST
ncbi:MAG: hypothetical protein ACYTGC_13700, partial [Planctomycetota bacterium]